MLVPSKQTVQQAAAILHQGGLVAFPTETVYGLGADARNPDALSRIFSAKGRPSDHPLIVHLADVAALDQWVRDVPAIVPALAARFWPGALTLILKRTGLVPDAVTGGQDTVGVRVPSHPVALDLLTAFGSGVAAPSANRFGRISPTRASHVADELGGAVDLILDGGDSQVGLESTILDLSATDARGRGARVLRPGGVSVAAIAAVLGYTPAVSEQTELRVSGSLPQHYAPQTPARLVDNVSTDHLTRGYGVIATRDIPAGFKGRWVNLGADPLMYAQRLYAVLRDLDNAGLDTILIEHVPMEAAWLAVDDRLRRATFSRSRDTRASAKPPYPESQEVDHD